MHHSRRAFGRVAIMGVLLTGLLATACVAATIELGRTSEIPAAEGKAKLRQTSNGNTEIKLSVKHLASPARIEPTSAVFVVWVRGLVAGDQPQNLGALRVNKNLSGNLKAVTSLREFDLFITCEGTQTVTAPTSMELLPVHYGGKQS